jgi:hypothetical protein
VSIRELWAEMDMMDEISHGVNSTGNVPRNTHRERRSLPSARRLANVQVAQIKELY